ncbi:GH116 family glycosyl-hydrolase [Terracidiphilus gabretensis]|uniref:GH116 family glycosyl-hydrolase n=1 Tax=Terracidiphilus gabretensis TaxID=1577687 RepID=UPI00071BF67C|nr:GH116 family glycosyl-hydrolase [Terracidiphilus gabretensis]
MWNKENINRRKFLLASSAAALGAAALPGAQASEPERPSSFQSKAGSLVPYSRSELLTGKSSAKVLSGAQAAEVAFPLGGIGTGTISLGGQGQLRDLEIFNRPAKGRILPFSFVALWAKSEGGNSSMRVVEGPPLPPFRGWNGYKRESGQGLPHFRGARFSGTYPIAHIDFEDSSLPVTVELEAFNPFIPLNVDDSSLPVVIFKYRVTNRTQKPVNFALAFSLMNPVGYDGKAFLEDSSFPGFGKNLTTLKEDAGAGTRVTGLEMTSGKYAAGDPRSGSLALLTTHPSVTARTTWGSGAWWDTYQKWVDQFSADGTLKDPSPAKPTDDGKSDYATLAPHAHLAPGESTTITFVLAWYFPVRENYWHDDNAKMKGKKLTNYYGTRFKSAWEVASHTASRLQELESKTRSFAESLTSSTLPPYVIEAVSSQASIMRTNTCILLEGKQFFGFEGCGDDQHNGWMNCSHVWNYEQVVAFLFPELERFMRVTDFQYEMRSDDSLAFRAMVPLGIEQWDFRPAADGQMGCIMKLYREWQLSGDTEFLKKMWPNAKRALEFAWKFWDADKDGVMEGEQHNTYDIEFFGANPMMTTLYLGALRAGEKMASALGENDVAARYHSVWASGVKNFETMWNGRFYIQKTTPVSDIKPMPPYDQANWKERVVDNGQLKYQFGAGCLSDQMLGQYFADVLGLDIGLPKDHVRSALQSVYRNNFMHTFWTHANTQRIYAINDENGLVLCSWPDGGRPALPFVYSDEVWTGVEYQVAADLIYRGLLEEGLAVAKAVSDRYDGVRRNPWNQIEWGNHYSRAMASYAVLLALSGFRYSAIEQSLTFTPRINQESFRCFFAAGSGWGTYTQSVKGSVQEIHLEVLHGEIPLRQIQLKNATGVAILSASVVPGSASSRLSKIQSELSGEILQIKFEQEIRLSPGNSVAIRLSHVAEGSKS